MDCFAVTLGMACGSRGLTLKQAVRMAAYFGGFQFVMPVIGWLAGDRLLGIIQNFDHWVAFGLLTLIGGRMIWESFEMSEEKKAAADQTQGKGCSFSRWRRASTPGRRAEPGVSGRAFSPPPSSG
jgi:putative Mn2+ efflux pump MntP